MNGRVNTALFRQKPPVLPWTLEDIGVRLRSGAIEHESMVMNDALVAAVKQVQPDAQPVFTYLANSVRRGERSFPYSLVAAMDRPELQADDEILLTEWAARDLQSKPGNAISFDYYLWDPGGRLVTRTATFTLRKIVSSADEDRYLAPEYPGISDVESMSDWDPPFPIDLSSIRPLDEEYWDKYRSAPKAFISLSAGQKLWRSRFGQATSVRVAAGFPLDKLKAGLDPYQAGLTLQDVRSQGFQASQGATDFAEYFLYFSFFIIVSALLLAGLFFRLGIESRLQEIRTLRALGFSIGQIRRGQLIEGLAIAAVGCLIGTVAAVLYALLILTGLRTWWSGAVGTTDLTLHLSPVGIMIGVAGGLLMSAW
ncbi:MAG: FtsX-like permease family protein [Bryobacteraceae bacterium]